MKTSDSNVNHQGQTPTVVKNYDYIRGTMYNNRSIKLLLWPLQLKCGGISNVSKLQWVGIFWSSAGWDRRLELWKPEIWAAGQIITESLILIRKYRPFGAVHSEITLQVRFWDVQGEVWCVEVRRGFWGVAVVSHYLLNEQVKLLSDLPAWIPSHSRDALQVRARQTWNTAPSKRLLHLHTAKMSMHN